MRNFTCRSTFLYAMDSLFGKADVSELPLVSVQVDADSPLHVPVQPRLKILRDWKPAVFFEKRTWGGKYHLLRHIQDI